MSALMKPAEGSLDSLDGTADTSSPARERHSLTLDQRRALRRWANSQSVRPSHKACIDWFRNQYDQTISQSTVSHSLSPKYARLDGDPQLSGSRLRFGNWPDVEKLVLIWHQQMTATGRQPSNEELAEKAKAIYNQLDRYKDEAAPEFSPGWIHRFKKRYGLLVRRQQRRSNTTLSPGEDLNYLVETVPKLVAIGPDVTPASIKEALKSVFNVETTLVMAARVRDEILRRLENPHQQHHHQSPHSPGGSLNQISNNTDPSLYNPDEDPEVVLQNALRALQQQEDENPGNTNDDGRGMDRSNDGLPGLGAIAGQAYAQHAATSAAAAHNAMNVSTPISAARASVGPGNNNGSNGGARLVPTTQTTPVSAAHNVGGGPAGGENLTLTPIPSSGPVSVTDHPVRCPFCVNQRMLRTIKEAVEHLSTHVIV